MSEISIQDAARDYWRQIFERSAKNPLATLVNRKVVLDRVKCESFGRFLAMAGIEADDLEKVRESIFELLSTAPITSPGVDPHVEYLLEGLCKRVEEACKRGNIPLREGVARGILPEVGVLAERRSVIMTDASIVVVGSQFFRFCSVLSKVLCVTLKPPSGDDKFVYDPDIAISRLRTIPAVFQYWTKFVLSFACTGSSALVEAYVLPKKYEGNRLAILHGIEIFAVAHEYAHHILRHGRRVEVTSTTGAEAEDHREEFEADAIAIAISQLDTGNTDWENPIAISGAAAIILLRASEMVTKARLILETGDDISQGTVSTHPSANQRFDEIDRTEWLWQSLEVELRDMRVCFDKIMRTVWEELQPVVKTLHKQGVRPLLGGNVGP